MATSVQRFAATVTAGTPLASPQVINLAVLPGVIDAIRWRVPPGPRGLFGWQLTMGGVSVIPENAGAFVIADDESDVFSISGLPDSGAWQVTGYNTGTYNHTVYLDFHVTPTSVAVTTTSDILAGFPQSESDISAMWLS